MFFFLPVAIRLRHPHDSPKPFAMQPTTFIPSNTEGNRPPEFNPVAPDAYLDFIAVQTLVHAQELISHLPDEHQPMVRRWLQLKYEWDVKCIERERNRHIN